MARLSLTVMSFNVRCGAADDGENGWKYRKDAAADLIAGSSPDLIGLQEAFSYQNDDLLARLPGYKMLGVGREDGCDEGEFCTILYRGDVPEDSGTFWLSESPDQPGSRSWDTACTRICTWARFRTFDFFNLHLDHQSQPAREQGVELLLSRIDFGRACIIAGDFNAGEDNAAIQTLRDKGFRDTYRILYPEGSAGTYHGFRDKPYPDKIDYIWVSPHWEIQEAQILSQKVDGRFPSDHYGLLAKIELA